jgi:hypothetical protein
MVLFNIVWVTSIYPNSSVIEFRDSQIKFDLYDNLKNHEPEIQFVSNVIEILG